MQRFFVEDAFLQFEDKAMPVSAFDVQYKLNDIPYADVVPALGRGLIEGDRALLEEVQEGQAVSLVLKIDGIIINLMSGFVANITASDNSTPTSRRLSARIRIAHRVVKLAGAPTMSFAYSGKTATSLSLLTGQLSTASLSGNTKANSLAKLSSVWETFIKDENASPEFAFYPTFILKRVVARLMEQYAPTIDVDGENGVLRDYPQANLTQINLDPFTLVDQLVDSFKDTWMRSNAWDALRRTMAYYQMAIVPYNTGVYLANPFGLLKAPIKEITSNNYINIRASQPTNLAEPVDGVVIVVPLRGVGQQEAREQPLIKNLIAYPPPAEGFNVGTDRFYHYRSLPAWLAPAASQPWGPVSGPVNRGKAGMVNGQKIEAAADFYETVGLRVAQLFYSRMKERKTAVRVTFPFKMDLMPGTNVSLENSGADDMSFLGTTMHGMINSTTISCSMLEGAGGRLNTSCEVVNVRSNTDNEELAVDTHPIYSNHWAGIDITGAFVSEVPDAENPILPAVPVRNNENRLTPPPGQLGLGATINTSDVVV
jgi:hypothetical protein